jgi:hypothetical protein
MPIKVIKREIIVYENSFKGQNPNRIRIKHHTDALSVFISNSNETSFFLIQLMVYFDIILGHHLFV